VETRGQARHCNGVRAGKRRDRVDATHSFSTRSLRPRRGLCAHEDLVRVWKVGLRVPVRTTGNEN
jgi:hypothetical protein